MHNALFFTFLFLLCYFTASNLRFSLISSSNLHFVLLPFTSSTISASNPHFYDNLIFNFDLVDFNTSTPVFFDFPYLLPLPVLSSFALPSHPLLHRNTNTNLYLCLAAARIMPSRIMDSATDDGGESTCNSDSSGPVEKFRFNEVIDSQKPSDAPTSSIPSAEQDTDQPSAEWTRICAKILRQDRNAAKSLLMQDAINLE